MRTIRILNASNINKALFAMDKRIKELEAQISGNVAETVSDEPVIETAPVTVDAAQEFNYLECDDKQELEDYGREIGIELDKRCKAETMQAQITKHLGVAE